MKLLQYCVLLMFLVLTSYAGNQPPKGVTAKLPASFKIDRDKPGNYTGSIVNLDLYTEETAQHWVPVQGGWKDFRRMVTTIDTAAGIVTVTELDSLNNQLVYSSKYVSYVQMDLAQGIFKINRNEFYQWNGSDWMLYAKTTYTYDGSGFLTGTLAEFQVLPGMFLPFSRTTFTNNSAGNPVVELVEQYSVEGNTWFNYLKTEFTYLPENPNYLTVQEQFEFESEAWVQYEKTTFSRNEKLNPVEIIYQCYYDGEPANCNKVVYAYKPDGETVETATGYYWYEQSSSWVNSNRTAYYYSAAGDLDLYTIQTWNGIQWQNVSRTSFMYDAQGRQIEELTENWVEIGYENILRYISVYTPTSVEDAAKVEGFVLKNNYPNPFNPSTKISYEITKPGNVSLTVYNMLGQPVAVLHSGYQQAGSYSYTFDATGLASGVYVYKLNAGKSSVSKKMVINK